MIERRGTVCYNLALAATVIPIEIRRDERI